MLLDKGKQANAKSRTWRAGCWRAAEERGAQAPSDVVLDLLISALLATFDSLTKPVAIPRAKPSFCTAPKADQ